MRRLFVLLFLFAPLAAVDDANAIPADCFAGRVSLFVTVSVNGSQTEDDINTMKSQVDADIKAIKSVAIASGVSSGPIINYSIHSPKEGKDSGFLSSNSNLRSGYYGDLEFAVTSEEQALQFVTALSKKGYASTFYHQSANCHTGTGFGGVS
jgi:hypothetical protein